MNHEHHPSPVPPAISRRQVLQSVAGATVGAALAGGGIAGGTLAAAEEKPVRKAAVKTTEMLDPPPNGITTASCSRART